MSMRQRELTWRFWFVLIGLFIGAIYYFNTPHEAGKVNLPMADFKGYGDKTADLCTEAYTRAVSGNPSYIDYRICNIKWNDKGQPSIELSK